MKRRILPIICIIIIWLLTMVFIPKVYAETYGDFEYSVKNDGTIEITSYNGGYKDVKIPSTINGKKVTSIKSAAFYYEPLTSVEIPETVTEIGSYAFENTMYLTKVTFKEGIKKIGFAAFRSSALEGAVVLPNSLEILDGYVFNDCNQVTSLALGKNIKTINGIDLAGMNDLEKITVDASNTSYVANSNILYDAKKETLIKAPAKLNINTFTVPQTVKRIDYAAFRGNLNLKSVTISNKTQVIASQAFAECKNLVTVNLGTGVKQIHDYAFNQTKIATITLPASLTYISGIAFIGDTYIQNINVDPNNGAFSSQNGVLFSKGKKEIILYPEGKSETSYIIPSTVEKIGNNAFSYAKIEKITIPNSVKTLGEYVFANSNLKNITIPSSVTNMSYGPVASCKQLTTANIQSKSDTLPYDMFSGCNNLTSVTLNDNIKTLDMRAFRDCTSLAKITLPNNLISIEARCFENCTSLKNVKIPATVQYIASSAFPKTEIDISKTRLKKMSDGSYRAITTINITGYFDYTKAYEVLKIVNQKRNEAGLSSLKMDTSLLETAMLRAAESSIYWNHTRPDGSSCYTANIKMNRENIAYGQASAERVMTSWMNSSGHRANIMASDAKSIGIGAFTYNGRIYWVQCFSSQVATEGTKPKDVTKSIDINASDSYLDLKFDESGIAIKIGETAYNPVKNYDTSSSHLAPVTLNPNCITWKSDNSKIATVDSNGKIKGMSCGTTTITAKVGGTILSYKVTVKLPFTDVSTDSWYYSAVEYCYRNNIIKGLNDYTFAPEDNLTRGMLVTILHRMEGLPYVSGKSKFPDVQNTNEYYYVAVKWATQNNIVSGYHNRKFGPNDPITREQLAVILNQYCKYKGKYKASDTNAGNLNKFSDGAKVSDYATYGMKWAVGAGVITGSKGHLNPQGTATRAEVASMLYKYCTRIK